ncbi:hypothetical protein SAMD00019534_079960 [Acytostelium subglobosum LB1]|uniref:hypothetical protein n=1 Tax=Acytostelium subglobosum LB1 TaxID=1410327 RepID=UPI00064498F5|nr:hypothetical protein SAMD00019534_079960 [Acytostelium subglobosum LB1]GAM24821.1 hypothetical protein SAMD00019534_079960 [Acytostelium subglobosum LB1]|eukprot:XP_012752490.1 hypothetical protein SAMD00019534_079960 [Acytostelium subglobosum LB1]
MLPVLLWRPIIDAFWPFPDDADEMERYTHVRARLQLALVCWNFHSIVKSSNDRLHFVGDALTEYLDSHIHSPFCLLSTSPITLELRMQAHHLNRLKPRSFTECLERMNLHHVIQLRAPVRMLPLSHPLPQLRCLELVVYDDLSTGFSFESELDTLRQLATRHKSVEKLSLLALLSWESRDNDHYEQLLEALSHSSALPLKELRILDEREHNCISTHVVVAPGALFSRLNHFKQLESLWLGISRPAVWRNDKVFYEALVHFLRGATALRSLEMPHIEVTGETSILFQHLVQHQQSSLTDLWLGEVDDTIPIRCLPPVLRHLKRLNVNFLTPEGIEEDDGWEPSQLLIDSFNNVDQLYHYNCWCTPLSLATITRIIAANHRSTAIYCLHVSLGEADDVDHLVDTIRLNNTLQTIGFPHITCEADTQKINQLQSSSCRVRLDE